MFVFSSMCWYPLEYGYVSLLLLRHGFLSEFNYLERKSYPQLRTRIVSDPVARSHSCCSVVFSVSRLFLFPSLAASRILYIQRSACPQVSCSSRKSFYSFPSFWPWKYILSCYPWIPRLDVGNGILYCLTIPSEGLSSVVSRIEIMGPCSVVLIETLTP